MDKSQALLESVVSTVGHLIKASIGRKKSQCVFIIGGFDCYGPALYQIDGSDTPQRVGYVALGSGSSDAYSVLDVLLSSKHGCCKFSDKGKENIGVLEATQIVRQAVRAGITNDLGSGSHVDFCIITSDGIDRWREKMVSSWERDHITSGVEKHNLETSTGMGYNKNEVGVLICDGMENAFVDFL